MEMQILYQTARLYPSFNPFSYNDNKIICFVGNMANARNVKSKHRFKSQQFPAQTMPKPSFIISGELIRETDRICVIQNRASRVYELIRSYGLLKMMELRLSKKCCQADLRLFHSEPYIEHLKKRNTDYDDESSVTEDDVEFGFVYDCPLIARIYEFCEVVAGGTVAAVEELLRGKKIAINWNGGWHHGERDQAKGFCYINDIAIGIEKLKQTFLRILYIDLDVHHGDGVENAFSTTKRVFTLSFHRKEDGFFPLSGDAQDCGFGPGLGYAANFPFKHNFTGPNYIKYFLLVANLVHDRYKPSAVVVQCGGDIIVGDPIGNCNITPSDVGVCVKEILSWNHPTIFLGGGGYNFINTAKYWTYLSSIIIGTDLPDDIPDDNNQFLSYGPDYELTIETRNLKDPNLELDLTNNYLTIQQNLDKYNVNF